MKYFLWKIAGGDCKLLEVSGHDSQYSYSVIGILYLSINIVTYLGFFGLFYGVFDNLFTAVFGTIVLGFLITTIYRLNLISLEPHTLPMLDDGASLFFTYVVRYTTISLFAFFVSKCFEMVIVSAIETSGFIDYNGSEGYLKHMTRMNQDQPWIWMITLFVILLFLIPIYLRHRLNRAREYYSLKERRDIRLVLEQYKASQEEKSFILSEIYSNYKPFGEKKNYVCTKIYDDEPFNTKLKVVERNLGSSEDFLNTILKM